MDPFIAQITVFGCNFAPLNWALCQGQLLAISQNTALFSLIGTYYGGNGTTTFALPDLRSRASIGFGQGPGLSNYAIGENGG
jgi:microcystin-dependent protein